MPRILPDAVLHTQPWTFVRSEAALPRELLEELEALFEGDWTWQEHRSFYEAQIAVVPPPAWASELREGVAGLLDLPLTERVGLTLQVMEPGQFAGVHSDRALLGYEAARLVVQLSRDWQGGEFTVHATAEGPELAVFSPHFGSAVGFEMHPDSHHAVRPAGAERRTAVFHFEHRGNTRELEACVLRLFEGMAFGELPEELPIEELEAEVDEEASFRACAVAWALMRWGCSMERVVEGLEASARQALPRSSPEVLLAAWAVQMRFVHADLRSWGELRSWLAGRALDGEVERFRELAFRD